MNTIESTLQTRRLAFRFLTPDDLDVIYRQFSDPEMCRYFSEPPCSLEVARGIIAHYQNPQGKPYLRYGLFDRQSGEFIGTCGYHYSMIGFLTEGWVCKPYCTRQPCFPIWPRRRVWKNPPYQKKTGGWWIWGKGGMGPAVTCE